MNFARHIKIGSNQNGTGCDMYVQLTILPRLIGTAELEITICCAASVTELIYYTLAIKHAIHIHMK